uniref:Ovule protein n=1 Tax=Syphacia muris TaxID=451379 RepID=A0A0N5AWD9_9BILA
MVFIRSRLVFKQCGGEIESVRKMMMMMENRKKELSFKVRAVLPPPEPLLPPPLDHKGFSLVSHIVSIYRAL